MVLGDKLLAVAGRPDPSHEKDGDRNNRVMMVSTADGSSVVESALSAEPVFDGMIAVDGKLFVSLANGEVVCLGKAAP